MEIIDALFGGPSPKGGEGTVWQDKEIRYVFCISLLAESTIWHATHTLAVCVAPGSMLRLQTWNAVEEKWWWKPWWVKEIPNSDVAGVAAHGWHSCDVNRMRVCICVCWGGVHVLQAYMASFTCVMRIVDWGGCTTKSQT